MILRTFGLLSLVSIASISTCFGGATRVNNANSGGAAGVRNFTDSDIVTGVANGPDEVWVATLRGVIKYPAGGGAATRYTTREGLPDNQVYAVSADPDGNVWVATARGVAKWDRSGRFVLAGDPQAQPSIGRPTAILALAGGIALVGGSQGIARWDGTIWHLLTDRYQVMNFGLDQGRPVVATAQHGVLGFRGDFSGVDEYGSTTGIPDTLVRNIVGVGEGKFWALVQGNNGSKLLFHDGHRWFAYTHSQARAPWIALIPVRNTAVLLTRAGAFEINHDVGEELTPIGSDISQPAQPRRVDFQPRRIEPPPPPVTPVTPATNPRTRGRGARPATPAARPAATAPRPAHKPETIVQRGAQSMPDAGAAGAARDASVSGVPVIDAGVMPRVTDAGVMPRVTDAGVRMDASVGASMDAAVRRDAGVVRGDTGVMRVADARAATSADASVVASADSGAAAQAVASLEPPPRPRNIPEFAAPVEVPPPGPTVDAPRFALNPTNITVPDDTLSAFVSRDSVFLSRIGLGVARVAGGGAQDFRAHDLAMSRRPLSLATDTANNVWFVSEDGGAVKFDGRRFSRATLDPEGQAVPLMFWSRGTTCVAVGRVGPNTLRTFRFARETNDWRQITERPVDTRGPGTVDVKFLAVDERNRFWIGIRVIDRPGGQGALELGVAMIDENVPSAIQFHHEVPPQGAEFGAVPVPSDLTAADFDADGNVWFAGLSGATEIIPPTAAAPNTPYRARTFNEATGLRGDQVSDVARGISSRVYVATTEGLGYWNGERFAFDVVGSTAQPRVTSLTADNNGALWGAGQRGAWSYDGSNWRRFGRSNGLPTEEFIDIAVDGENRVWFVTNEGISLLEQGHSSAGGSTIAPTAPH